MTSIGFQEILIILFIALIIFGAKKLPEIGYELGKALNAFKKALNDKTNSDATQDDKNQIINK